MLKVGLEGDFNSEHYWERLVEFAKEHSIDYLVAVDFMGNSTNDEKGNLLEDQERKIITPYLYNKYPGLLTDKEMEKQQIFRTNIKKAHNICKSASLEFWNFFEVLLVPSQIRKIIPEMFNKYGEPDMSGNIVYEFISNQIDELVEIAPDISGLELWVMECGNIVISDLKHQDIPLKEICSRIVDTVYGKCAQYGVKLAVCLHTAWGNREMRKGLINAALTHSDIIVCADDVIGDFHLHLPFHVDMTYLPQNQTKMLIFDLNGEYWGRSFLPTSALSRYKLHIDKAKSLGFSYIAGRISTCHDCWSPHFNVLPSRKHLYLENKIVKEDEPLPTDLDICCFDTLFGFNTEFFLNYIKDSFVTPLEVVKKFLKKEFGNEVDELSNLFLDIERIAARIHFADRNYFGLQSVLPSTRSADYLCFDVQYTTSPGNPFPPVDGLSEKGLFGERRADALLSLFVDFLVPMEYRASGSKFLIYEKQEALLDAQDLLINVKKATVKLKKEDRKYIVDHFEDFVLYSRAAALLLEALVHYYHIRLNKKYREIPDKNRLKDTLREMSAVSDEWKKRQPYDEWKVSERLQNWIMEISKLNL